MKSISYQYDCQPDPDIDQIIRYGFDEAYLWIEGQAFKAKVAWQLLSCWQEETDSLTLFVEGIPPFIFPVDGLKSHNAYSELLRLVRKHLNKKSQSRI